MQQIWHDVCWVGSEVGVLVVSGECVANLMLLWGIQMRLLPIAVRSAAHPCERPRGPYLRVSPGCSAPRLLCPCSETLQIGESRLPASLRSDCRNVAPSPQDRAIATVDHDMRPRTWRLALHSHPHDFLASRFPVAWRQAVLETLPMPT